MRDRENERGGMDEGLGPVGYLVGRGWVLGSSERVEGNEYSVVEK